MTDTSYEAAVAGASVIKPAVPSALPKAVRALEAPTPRPIEWLVDGIWPRGELGLFVGDGGAFKSTVALHFAAAIAGGYPVFDRYQVEQRPALIVSAEDSQDVVLMRLNALIAGHNWNRSKTLKEVYLLCDGDQSLGDVKWRMHFSAEVERIKPGFIVLDPWAELLGGDENSNTDVRPAVQFLRSVGRSVDASIAVVHHAGKAAPEKRIIDRIRGASALPHASRVIWFFDWQDTGVAVENIKQSRAPKVDPFVVQRTIDSLPSNRAQWTAARLTTVDRRAFELTRAERFVVEQLRLLPAGEFHTTGSLRAVAREIGHGIGNHDMNRAQQSLLAKGIVAYKQGKQNTRHWYLTPASEWSGPTGFEGNGTGIGPNAVGGNDRTEELSDAETESTPDLFGESESLPGSSGRLGQALEPGQKEPAEPAQSLPAGSKSLPPSLLGPPLGGSEGSGTGFQGRADSAGSNLPIEEDPEALLAEVDESLGRIEFDEAGEFENLRVSDDEDEAL